MMLKYCFNFYRFNTDARDLLYIDFPKHFKWVDSKHWERRVRGKSNTVCRLYTVTPLEKERFYLRMLLHCVRGATSFEDIRTVDGITYSTFMQAAQERGILEKDDEWDQCLQEASASKTPIAMRKLFVIILSHCSPSSPGHLWHKYKGDLSEDFTYQLSSSGISLSDQEREKCHNRALHQIDELLNKVGWSVSDFPDMPILKGELYLKDK